MLCPVVFRKVNNIHGRVECEDFDFLILLREHLTFEVEGHQFMPAFKIGMWDGKIRLLEVDGECYLGLWEMIKNFCERENRVCYIDPQISTKSLPYDKFLNFVDSLNVHSGGDKIDPYDYQKDAAHWALEQQRCLLLSPTSSGKSLIIYTLARMYQRLLPDPEDQILLVVPKAGLVHQMYSDFGDYSSNVDWDVKTNCHKIKGKEKSTDKKITITTYQSLTNKKTRPPKQWFSRFKAVMVDEVHKATADSVMSILEACTEAEWKVGLTGTFDESKTHEYTLRGLFGPVKKVITTKELMDSGRVANLTINVGLVQHADEHRKKLRNFTTVEKNGKKKKIKATYAQEVEFIVNNWERNKFLMNLAAGLQGNTILMINQVEHGENLYKWMRQALPDRKIYLYTGRVKDDEREHIRQVVENLENAIIIGSLGVLSTGISIKRLDNLIFGHPTKSKVLTLQSVGRILRRCKHTDNLVTMYDIVDCFNAGSYENYTYGHGQERVRFYDQEQFKYNMVTIPLEVT